MGGRGWAEGKPRCMKRPSTLRGIVDRASAGTNCLTPGRCPERGNSIRLPRPPCFDLLSFIQFPSHPKTGPMSSPPPPQLFAVVPAAGQSRRMGRPKLLLPLGSDTVIGRMLALLRRPEIAATIVVVRPDDELLRAAVLAGGAV